VVKWYVKCKNTSVMKIVILNKTAQKYLKHTAHMFYDILIQKWVETTAYMFLW